MKLRALRSLWPALAFLCGLSAAGIVSAHEIRPALLEITEREPGRFDVTWKVPTRGNRALALTPILPKSLRPLGPPTSHTIPGASIENRTYGSDGQSLGGETISIEGLSATLTDALLRIRLIGGKIYSTILRPGEPSFRIPHVEEKDPAKIFRQNLEQAFWHLASTINHSLLILVLVLLASGSSVFKILIAFVLGHAASMVVVDVGLVTLAPALAEVLSAVAIILAARHVILGHRNLAQFMTLVFLVSLFHGLEHARILAETSSAQPGLLQGLLAFNLGLDLGQFLLAILFAGVLVAARRLKSFETIRWFTAYAVGVSAVVFGIGTFVTAISGGPVAETGSPRGVSQLETVLFQRPGTNAPRRRASLSPPRLEAPMQAFLVIEPYEVRLEVLLRAMVLEDLDRFKAIDGKKTIEPEAQEAFIADLLALMRDKSGVIIDGKKATPSFERGEFVTIGSYGILTRQKRVPEKLDEALIGLTFVYQQKQLPQEVTFKWGLFLSAAKEVPVTTADPFGGKQSSLTAAEPTLRWQNRLTGYEVPVIEPVLVSPPRVPLVSIVLALGSVVLLLVAGRSRSLGTYRVLGTIFMLTAIVCYPFVRTAVPLAGSTTFKPTGNEARTILDGLLTNVYRSFDLRDEDAVYDRLALTVAGDQLSDIYLQSRQALELEDRGGARGKVDEVDVGEVRDVKRENDGTFSVDADWTVGGSVSHFGHTHYRQNRYHAIVSIVPDGDTWKIRRLTLLDERRLL